MIPVLGIVGLRETHENWNTKAEKANREYLANKLGHHPTDAEYKAFMEELKLTMMR